jgi:hypothetical protein
MSVERSTAKVPLGSSVVGTQYFDGRQHVRQQGGCFRCELTFIKLLGEDNDLAYAKTLWVICRFLTCDLHIFTVIDFIQDMAAI